MRVMVVDDDPVLRMIWKRILAQEPSLVIAEAEDGLAAWNLMQTGEPPALCIMDVNMPRMDGMELLERVRSHPKLKRIKVLMCTSVNDRMNVAYADSLEVNGYILKPLSPQKAIDEVRRLVKGASGAAAATVSPAPQDSPSCVVQLRTGLKAVADLLATARMAAQGGDKTAAITKLKALSEASTRLGLTGLTQASNAALQAFQAEPPVDPAGPIHALASEVAAIQTACNRLSASWAASPASSRPPATISPAPAGETAPEPPAEAAPQPA